MKTLQKTIWMLCLLFGIVSSILYSCTTTEYLTKTNYLYKNDTPETLQMTLFNINSGDIYKNYSIAPNSELTIENSSVGPKTGVIEPYVLNSRGIGKVILKFENSQKCLEFLKGEGILNSKAYDNYSPSMENNSKNTLFFNINQEELDKATDCK